MQGIRRRIYLVRHGAARGADGRAVGHLDLPLSAAGAASIRTLQATWNGSPPARLFTSDLMRARDSAAILEDAWGVSARVDPRLREVDFGDWDGALWSELHELPGFDRWLARWWQLPPPGGEPFTAVGKRARAWLEEVLAGDADPVVAVAHGGSIRALLCHVLAMPVEKAFHLHLDHGRVSALGETFRGLEVLLLNSERFSS